jgi:hypothetical protein
MPALVKRRVGSFSGTRGLERTTACPRLAKKFKKDDRTDFADVELMGPLGFIAALCSTQGEAS